MASAPPGPMQRIAWVVVGATAGCAAPAESLDTHVSALTVGAEQDLEPSVLGAAPDAQFVGRVLDTGSGYLAVWTDYREGWGVSPTTEPRAYAARVADDATVLDPTGFPIAPQNPTFWSITGLAGACAPTGTCLVVAKQGNQQIAGIRIRDDEVLDATPLTLTPIGFSVDPPEVAWDGAAFRLVWRDIYNGIYSLRVAEDGTIGPSVLIAIDSISTPVSNATVGCDGVRCLIAFRRGSGTETSIAGRLIDATGGLGVELQLLDHPGVQQASAPIWDGARYWLGVYDDPDASGPLASMGAVVRIASDGTTIDPGGITIATAVATVPQLDTDGAIIRAMWSQLGAVTSDINLYTARIATDGTVLDPGGFEVAAAHAVASEATFACRTDQCLAAWTVARYADRAVEGTRLAAAAELDPTGVPIATSPAGETDAAITFGAGQYLAVWRDNRASPIDNRVAPIHGALVPPTLAPVTPIVLAPSTPPAPSEPCPDQAMPAVAAAATAYLVAWREGCTYYSDNIYGQIVTATGDTPAPPFAIDVANLAQSNPATAASADQFLVVWDTAMPSPPSTIQARRYTATGAPLDAGRFQISANGAEPAIAFDGTRYLVAWSHDGTSGGTNRDVRAARVGTDGVVLDPAGITVADTSLKENAISVACGGGVCLIAWRRGPSEIRAARVAPDGTVLDPDGVVIGPVTGTERQTAVTFDGTAFVVVWWTGAGVLDGAVVARDGTITTPAGLIADAATPLELPALASDGAGHVLALYDRFDPDAAYRVRRVRARVIGPPLEQPDAATPDAPIVIDAGLPDAVVDAPVPPDAPIIVDAPVPPDAPIIVDAPVPPDAPIIVDAPVPPDAPINVDAGLPDAAPPAPDARGGDGGGGGCGCRSSGSGGGGTVAWILGVAFGLRRRRGPTRRTARA